MGGGADGSERIGRNLPSVLPDGFLDGREHRLRHLYHITHKGMPFFGIRRPLAGGLDLRIERRLLSASGWNVRPVLWDRGIILAAMPLSHVEASLIVCFSNSSISGLDVTETESF
jgi:hypothetical protein